MESKRYLGLGPLAWAILISVFIALLVRTTSARSQTVSDLCPSKETRLGYAGFKHCELHAQYQIAFKNWNCHCYSGQCRPTMFRAAPRSETNLTGFEIFIDGGWFRLMRSDASGQQ